MNLFCKNLFWLKVILAAPNVEPYIGLGLGSMLTNNDFECNGCSKCGTKDWLRVGSMLTNNDFECNDFVKLILAKIK